MQKTVILIMFSVILSCLLLLAVTESSAINPQSLSAKFGSTNNTIDSIKTAIQKHKITCEQIVTAYIEYIKKYNLDTTRGSAINAFVNINPLIFAQARFFL